MVSERNLDSVGCLLLCNMYDWQFVPAAGVAGAHEVFAGLPGLTEIFGGEADCAFAMF